MGRLTRLGVDMPLRMYIDQDARDAQRYVPQIVQGGLGLPDRDYYLVADDAKFKDARASYVAYLARLLDAVARAGRRGGVGARPCSASRRRWRGPVDARRDPRSGQDLQPGRARRAGAARARLRLAGVARRHRPRRQDRRRDRPAAELPRRPSRRSCRRRRCRSGRPTCAPTCSARTRRTSARTSSTPASPSSARRCRARPRTCRAGSAASRLVEGVGGRVARQALRRRLLPAGVEGAHGKARRQPARRLPRQHRRDRLDEPGDASRRRRPSSRRFAPKIGYPEALDRLRRARDREATTCSATSGARASSTTRATSPSSASRSIATSGS